MVRNSEKKMTRKIRKNRQTRRKRVLKMKTKMRKNRMHKTMKGGTLRETLKSTGELGKQINRHLNNIAKSIAENPQGDNFIQSYNAALRLTTNPTAPNQAWMPVAPAAGSTPMIQFIPDRFLENILDSIQVLIQEIMNQYSELCSTFRGRTQCGDRHDLFKLTPGKFNEMLRKVCMGEVHNTHTCLGRTCSRFNIGITDFNNLNTSLSKMVGKLNQDDSNHNTTFGSITSSSEGGDLDFTIMLQSDQLDQSDSVSLSVRSSVLRIYVELYNLLKEDDVLDPTNRLKNDLLIKNDLLNPNYINCKACIIVMPPFIKYPAPQGHGQLMSPVTYGYHSFKNAKLFDWVPLKEDERLEPNSYCASRKYKRTMANDNTLLRLNYTMSPLVIPNGLLPLQSLEYHVQSQHNSLLQTMKDMLVMNLNPQTQPTDEFIQKKAELKSHFETNGKVEMTHIYDQDGFYYYYELKIQKTTIPVKNTVGPHTTIDIKAVIIEFKVFSEDGICSKEIIFVSYKRPDDDGTSLPGYIKDDNNVQVRPETMNSAIHELFVNKFLELDHSLYLVAPDKTVLSLIDSAGQLASRGSQSSTHPTKHPTKLQPVVAHSDGSATSDISTIILEKNNSKFSWSIAKATETQKGAFTAVNKHITTKKEWTLQRGETIFPVDNQNTGNEEIKVTVRVLTVDATNQLLSATYQAQDSVPYLLFANNDEAQKYLQSKMMI
jgi:hypothetical protein